MLRQFLTFAVSNRTKMVIELIIVWALAVVAFFLLWAVLLKVVQRFSKRKKREEL